MTSNENYIARQFALILTLECKHTRHYIIKILCLVTTSRKKMLIITKWFSNVNRDQIYTPYIYAGCENNQSKKRQMNIDHVCRLKNSQFTVIRLDKKIYFLKCEKLLSLWSFRENFQQKQNFIMFNNFFVNFKESKI